MKTLVFPMILLGVLASSAPAFADDACNALSNLVSRPTVSVATCTLAPNQVLIETGYTNLSASSGGNQVSYPQTYINIGTEIPRLNIEFSPPMEVRNNGLHGSTDIAASIKYLLRDTARFQGSAMLGVTAATGDAFASANSSQTSFILNEAYSLSPVFSLAGSQQIQALAANGIRYGAFTPSLVLSAALPHASSLFGEYALMTHANGPATGTRTQLMFGVSHDVGKCLQLDAEGITSPTQSTGKYTGFGFGASYLL